VRECGLDSSGSRWGPVYSCEHGNETLDSSKGGKFFDWLVEY